MINLFKIFMVFSSSLMVTTLLLPPISWIASRIRLMDYPNKRKVHDNPKPIVGGLVIGIAVFFSSLLFISKTQLTGYYAGMVLLLTIGILDDFKELSCNLRFGMQTIASLFMIYFSDIILRSFGDILSTGPINLGILSIPITILCTVGVINSFNMIDGTIFFPYL